MIRKELRVFGQVQGVFFRKSTKEKAQALGLTGFVKNLPDGSVLIEAQGEAAAIKSLQDWAKLGPERAQVTDVQSQEIGIKTDTTFRIAY